MTVETLTPLEEVLSWGTQMADRLDSDLSSTLYRAMHRLPVDLYETKDEIYVEAALAGFAKENVKVEFHQGRIVIQAERPLPSADVRWLRSELPYGTFYRSIQIGPEVLEDHIEATWSDGVLKVRLPKAEAARPKSIPVKVASESREVVGTLGR